MYNSSMISISPKAIRRLVWFLCAPLLAILLFVFERLLWGPLFFTQDRWNPPDWDMAAQGLISAFLFLPWFIFNSLRLPIEKSSGNMFGADLNILGWTLVILFDVGMMLGVAYGMEWVFRQKYGRRITLALLGITVLAIFLRLVNHGAILQ